MFVDPTREVTTCHLIGAGPMCGHHVPNSPELPSVQYPLKVMLGNGASRPKNPNPEAEYSFYPGYGQPMHLPREQEFDDVGSGHSVHLPKEAEVPYLQENGHDSEIDFDGVIEKYTGKGKSTCLTFTFK